MNADELQVSMKEVARFSIMRQHLSGTSPKYTDDKSKILDVFKDIKYIQLDPTNVVERSHNLTLWSRIGKFHRQSLQDLIYRERRLVEFYAHSATISIDGDLPLLRMGMQERRELILKTRPELKKHVKDIKRQIEVSGPLISSKLSELKTNVTLGGWGHERKVNLLLDLMHRMGDIAICGRTPSNQKVWGNSENFIREPEFLNPVDRTEAEKQTFLNSLEALGIASPDQVVRHYIPMRVSNARETVRSLLEESLIIPVKISIPGSSRAKTWYIRREDVSKLEKAGRAWKKKSTLLSPFDNLTIDRKRAMEVFNFDGRMELYVPKNKRKYGFYTMPFLYGERIVGRIDPLLDRKKKTLRVNAIHDEGNNFSNPEIKKKLLSSIDSLAEFLQADSVELPDHIERQN